MATLRIPHPLLAVVLALFACGKDDDGTESTAGEAGDTTASTTATDTNGSATNDTDSPTTSSSTSTGNPSTTNTTSTSSTTGSDESAWGPCSECQPPNMCAQVSMDGGNYCAPPCTMPGGTDCPPAPAGSSAAPICAAQAGSMYYCALVCMSVGGQGECPTGMCCEAIPQPGYGVCTWATSCGGGTTDATGSETGTGSAETGSETGTAETGSETGTAT